MYKRDSVSGVFATLICPFLCIGSKRKNKKDYIIKSFKKKFRFVFVFSNREAVKFTLWQYQFLVGYFI